jgi:hypothetical protein
MNDTTFWEAIRKYRYSASPIDPRVIEWAKNWPDKILTLAITTSTRFTDCESNILDYVKRNDIDFHSIAGYCNNAYKGRWPELETVLINSKDSYKLTLYAAHVVKGRWKDVEKFICDPKSVIEYSRNVLHSRWEEKEDILLKDPRLVFDYCYHVMKKERWKEGEECLINCDYNNKINIICNYARYVLENRWPEAEEMLKKDPYYAYVYADTVVQGRWEEAEETIAKRPEIALRYAQDVLKGAFPLAEKNLLASDFYFDYFNFSTAATRDLVEKLANQFDPNMTVNDILKKVKDGRNKDFETKLLNSTHNQKKAVWYASNVLKTRWIEAEDAIKRSPRWSVAYAKDVIKGRWEEAEKTISKDPKYLAEYGVEVIKGELPNFLHNMLVAEKLKGSSDKKINKYFQMLEDYDQNK